MTVANEVVFLLDVENTLLDNDRIAVDPGAQLFMKSWQTPMQHIASKSATRANCRLQEPHR